MKVLLSIKPEYVNKIFSGEKTYEYRRGIWKNENVKTVVVYSTSPVKKIIGEFQIEKIEKANPKILWKLDSKHTGISREKFMEYFGTKEEGYAIKIGKLKKYKETKELKDFNIKNAPQSFIYIKE